VKIGKHGGLLSVLRHRDFRLLIGAFSVSAAGSWAYNVGLAVFIWEQTHSPAWVAAATIGRFVPCVLFGAYGGVLAERFERVRVMVTLDLICTTLMGVLTVIAAVEGPVLLAIIVASLNSVTSMMYQPAVAAITPQVVPEKDLAAANTMVNTVENLAIIAGPALGGLLLVAGSVSLAFGANALSFLWSAAVVSRMKARSQPVDVTEGGKVGPLRQMLVGAQAILSSVTAGLLVTYSVIASFVYGSDTVLFVVLSQDRLGTGAEGYGYLLAGLGVGGLLGATVVNRISAWPRLGTAILTGMAVYCLPTLLFLSVDVPAEAFVIQVVRGAGTLIVDVLAITALQRSIPEEKLARVFGAFFTFVLLAISIGAAVTPQVLSHTSLDTTLLLAGLAIPAACLLGWPWLRRMDNANVLHLAEIAPRIAILQRTAIMAEGSRAVLERVASHATEIEVAADQPVVTQGEEADAFYVVEEGAMAVTSHGEGDAEQEYPPLAVGDYFGEIGLMERIPRTATVTATAPSKLLRIDGDEFLEAVNSSNGMPSLLEGARTRLARTHPTYRPQAITEELPA
jgi:predicted MFS family arabinose efflux permease